jgi:hypothetical protein
MDSTTSPAVTPAQREAFYAAAAAGLCALEVREGSSRRFGPDADMRWAAFRGALSDADRLDLLLRDAAVTWGAAFSPAAAFGLFGLAPDDPFGPDWRPIAAQTAHRLMEAPQAPPEPARIAALFGIAPQPVQLPALTPSTHLIVAGGAALLAVAQAFQGQGSLSWSHQVLAVAVCPEHRQLAALLAIPAGSTGGTRLVRPGADLRAILTGAGFAQVDSAVVSPDAEPACRDFARRAAGVA